MGSIASRLDKLKKLFSNADFLANKGFLLTFMDNENVNIG